MSLSMNVLPSALSSQKEWEALMRANRKGNEGTSATVPSMVPASSMTSRAPGMTAFTTPSALRQYALASSGTSPILPSPQFAGDAGRPSRFWFFLMLLLAACGPQANAADNPDNSAANGSNGSTSTVVVDDTGADEVNNSSVDSTVVDTSGSDVTAVSPAALNADVFSAWDQANVNKYNIGQLLSQRNGVPLRWDDPVVLQLLTFEAAYRQFVLGQNDSTNQTDPRAINPASFPVVYRDHLTALTGNIPDADLLAAANNEGLIHDNARDIGSYGVGLLDHPAFDNEFDPATNTTTLTIPFSSEAPHGNPVSAGDDVAGNIQVISTIYNPMEQGFSPQTVVREATSAEVSGNVLTVTVDGVVPNGSLVNILPGAMNLTVNGANVPMAQRVIVHQGPTTSEVLFNARSATNGFTLEGTSGAQFVNFLGDSSEVYTNTAVISRAAPTEERCHFYLNQLDQMFAPLVESGQIAPVSLEWNKDFLKAACGLPTSEQFEMSFGVALRGPSNMHSAEPVTPSDMFSPGDVESATAFVVANLLMILETPGNGVNPDASYVMPEMQLGSGTSLNNPMLEVFFGRYARPDGTQPNAWGGIYTESYLQQIQNSGNQQHHAYVTGWEPLPDSAEFGRVFAASARDSATQLEDPALGMAHIFVLRDDLTGGLYTPWTLAAIFMQEFWGHSTSLTDADTYQALDNTPPSGRGAFWEQLGDENPEQAPDSLQEEVITEVIDTLAWIRLVSLYPEIAQNNVRTTEVANAKALALINTIGANTSLVGLGSPDDGSEGLNQGNVLPGVTQGPSTYHQLIMSILLSEGSAGSQFGQWFPNGSQGDAPFAVWLGTYKDSHGQPLIMGPTIAGPSALRLSNDYLPWDLYRPLPSDTESTFLPQDAYNINGDNFPDHSAGTIRWMSQNLNSSMAPPSVMVDFLRALDARFTNPMFPEQQVVYVSPSDFNTEDAPTAVPTPVRVAQSSTVVPTEQAPPPLRFGSRTRHEDTGLAASAHYRSVGVQQEQLQRRPSGFNIVA